MEEQPNDTPRIFKKPISDELFWNIFSLVGIKNHLYTSWFKKNVITDEKCKEFLKFIPQLKEYYHKHKYFVLNREINPTRMIQIMRQMARSKGYSFESKEYVEKSFGSPKRMMYRLICSDDIPLTQFQEQSYLVVFE